MATNQTWYVLSSINLGWFEKSEGESSRLTFAFGVFVQNVAAPQGKMDGNMLEANLKLAAENKVRFSHPQ
jgi:hypothetical protein